MTIIVCLTNIAKQRPIHFTTVVQAFELLHGEYYLELIVILLLICCLANLPPSYSPSQVSSVRKQLKVGFHGYSFSMCILNVLLIVTGHESTQASFVT